MALQRLQDETGEPLPSELLLAAALLSFGILGGRLLAGVFGAKPQKAAAGHELWLWGSPLCCCICWGLLLVLQCGDCDLSSPRAQLGKKDLHAQEESEEQLGTQPVQGTGG